MDQEKILYPGTFNPLFHESSRPLPKEVAIIGAGTIGPDIGYYLKSALPEITFYMVDVAEEPLKRAEKRFSSYTQKALDRKKMSGEMVKAVLENIVFTTEYDKIKDCDLVVEAATENIPLKQRIFEQVEAIVSRKAVITSNTSSIPADRIFNRMKHPERATVTHFFAPAWRSLPVEVIRWEGADPATVDDLCWFFAHTGKVPIVTANAICFMLDRIFDNWCNEAAYLLDQATASQIDKVAEEFVYAGPFFVLNMANGNPIIIETNTLQMEEGPHYRPAPILASVERWVTHRPGSEVEVPDDLKGLIRDRLLGILFSQTFDILDRDIGTASDLNLGCQIALGFRKGPLDLMRDLGEEEVARIMAAFEKARPGFPQPRASFSEYQKFLRHLLVDEREGVKIITIRRPQAMNAINDEVTNEILEVLKSYENDPSVKGFVLTGYGEKAFSAGADIGRLPEMLGDREASIDYAKTCAEVQLYMDRMGKPVVAAVNGLALGGGLELAIRCHAIAAAKNASFQFPEITLGILPAIGGCVVPYRKWPKGAALFHDMLLLGRPLSVQEALEIGMVGSLAEDYPGLIRAAVEEVGNLEGRIPRIPDGKVEIPPVRPPDSPAAGNLVLSREAVGITAKTIQEGAAAETFEEALEVGYRGFGEIACTGAAREGISAFLEKRKPVYKK
ncbi:MAG: 3-hydroxyacyl-CoA dehydrogenase/enoyl-CoA hydratase family protein [Deltaproteobacteria bacterium]|nr:3-hydroxyacyl-CoA dehydrogenase/enoyl-CoA hydratase family protein [Deltaproteobacteria bacterium]